MGIALRDEVKQMLDHANFALGYADGRWIAAERAGVDWARWGSDGDLHRREVAQGAEYAARSASCDLDCGFSRSLSGGADSWAGGGVAARSGAEGYGSDLDQVYGAGVSDARSGGAGGADYRGG